PLWPCRGATGAAAEAAIWRPPAPAARAPEGSARWRPRCTRLRTVRPSSSPARSSRPSCSAPPRPRSGAPATTSCENSWGTSDRRVADLHPGRLDRGRGMVAGVVVARRGLHRGGLAGGGAPRQPRRFAGGAGAGHGGLPRVSVPVRRPGGRGPSGVALLWHHRRPAGPEAAGGPQLRPGSAAAGAGCPVRSLCRLLAEPGRPVAEPRREAGAAEEVLPPQGGAHRRGHPRDAPGAPAHGPRDEPPRSLSPTRPSAPLPRQGRGDRGRRPTLWSTTPATGAPPSAAPSQRPACSRTAPGAPSSGPRLGPRALPARSGSPSSSDPRGGAAAVARRVGAAATPARPLSDIRRPASGRVLGPADCEITSPDVWILLDRGPLEASCFVFHPASG
ncbi:unnamed protein product, partial [Prorocentrum cordatum]